jgi:hypothetical protein
MNFDKSLKMPLLEQAMLDRLSIKLGKKEVKLSLRRVAG